MEFLSLKGGCTGLSESTLVKIPHFWKSHVTTQLSKLATGKISRFLLVCLAVQVGYEYPLFFLKPRLRQNLSCQCSKASTHFAFWTRSL